MFTVRVYCVGGKTVNVAVTVLLTFIVMVAGFVEPLKLPLQPAN